jgi:hypothetical protein
VALESLQWRAAVKRSSGRRRATWRGRKRLVRGREAAGPVLGRHVAQPRAARRRQGAAHGRSERRRRRREENRGGGREVDERGPGCNF